MKKNFFTGLFFLILSSLVQAQNTFPATGNVGIGTSNPMASLEVARGTGLGGTAAFLGTNHISHFNFSTAENTYIRGGKTGSSVLINDSHNGHVNIASGGGNVGIGATANYQRLNVNGNIHIPIGNSIGMNQADKFTYNGQDIGHYSLGWYTESGSAVANLSGAAGIRFFTNAAERMFITSSGKVGIGTASPNTTLHIRNGLWNGVTVAHPTYLRLAYGGAAENYTGEMSGIVFTKHYDIHQVAKIYSYANWATNSYNGAELRFATRPDGGTEMLDRMVIDQNGNVGINTADTKGYKLGVNGAAIATSMTVKLNANWPDFVFAKTYGLRSLSEVESYIKANSHLPEVPSAAQVAKDGINLGEMDATLLKKIEELTLYVIEMKKENEAQNQKIQSLEKQLSEAKK